MTNGLDDRIGRALREASATITSPDTALAQVVYRAGAGVPQPRMRKAGEAKGAILVAASVIVIGVAVIRHNRGDDHPGFAAIGMPSMSSAVDGCGDVAHRPATAAEVSVVHFAPNPIPDGWAPVPDNPSPQDVQVQERNPSAQPCWQADVAYGDIAGNRLLSASVSRQGVGQPACTLPPDWKPAECTTVQGHPAMLSHEGTRASLSWIDPSGGLAQVSGFGLDPAQLLDAAESLRFDGTTLTLAAPAGMTELDRTPTSRTDGRDITYWSLTYRQGSEEGSLVQVDVTTWNDAVVNEVGPITTAEINGAQAIVVTTGGPGTGIIGWTPDGPTERAAHAYATWNAQGVTFRVEGPDASTVLAFALALHHEAI